MSCINREEAVGLHFLSSTPKGRRVFGVSRPKSRGSKFWVEPAALERSTAIDSERVW